MNGKNPNSKRSNQLFGPVKSKNGSFWGESFVTFEPPVEEICIRRKYLGANHTPQLLVFRRLIYPNDSGWSSDVLSLNQTRVKLPPGDNFQPKPEEKELGHAPGPSKSSFTLSTFRSTRTGRQFAPNRDWGTKIGKIEPRDDPGS